MGSGFPRQRKWFFNDGKKAHTAFWSKYQRRPLEEYWDWMVERRDLLVPQDVRERKGSFFTPRKWVELSQTYLARTLGEDWQEEFVVWDCAAGTGNLLAGLTNKCNIFASTLDQADVNVMQERIGHGANLLPAYVFQFDFLNDDFIPQSEGGELPDDLYAIIRDEKKRKKLVIYINPPYAEATTARTVTGTGSNKPGVARGNKAHSLYKEKIGNAGNELHALFLMRIYDEINGAMLANFATLKNLQALSFAKFRDVFRAKLKGLFLIPANTFDNVNGQFPIGFHIWDTLEKESFRSIVADVYDAEGNFLQKKMIANHINGDQPLNRWIVQIKKIDPTSPTIGLMVSSPADFQHAGQLAILSKQQARYCWEIFCENLIPMSVYFTVRKAIPPTWINDRDQFLRPRKGWETDAEFQGNCLAYTLSITPIASNPQRGAIAGFPLRRRRSMRSVSLAAIL